jgi:hypothetical protein
MLKSTEHFDCFYFSSLISSLIVLDILPCHDLMRDNTYKSLVEVDILLRSVLVVDNCDIPLVLYLFQSLLFLFLHLYIELNPLVAPYTEASGYTMRYYSVVARYYTPAA